MLGRKAYSSLIFLVNPKGDLEMDFVFVLPQLINSVRVANKSLRKWSYDVPQFVF